MGYQFDWILIQTMDLLNPGNCYTPAGNLKEGDLCLQSDTWPAGVKMQCGAPLQVTGE